MADGTIQLPPDSTGSLVDTESLTVGGNTVHRERVQVAGATDTAIAPVDATAGLKVDLGADNDVTVQGEDAENAAAAANPVQVGGRYDLSPRTLGDGDVGAIALDADGAVQVSDGGNTLTVDGTVTADAGTGTFTIQEAAAMDVSAATVTVDLGANNDVTVQGEAAENAAVSGNPVLTGGRYDATPRVLGDGDVGAIALDADGAVHIADGGNAITVDGTVTADAGTGTFTVDNAGTFAVQVDAALPAGTNAIGKLAANSGVDIGDVDVLSLPGVAAEGSALGSGILIQGDDGTDRTNVLVDTDGHLQVDVLSGGGGGTQYTEDAVAPADPVGTAVALVRDDTPVAIAADGDIVAQRATQYGAAYTQILDSSGNFIDSFGGSGGTASTDDAAFTPGSGQGTPAMFMADETTPDSVDEGDVGVGRMTLSRKQLVTLSDPTSENHAGVDASGNLQVDIAADSVGIGGGTQYTEAATDATITGTALMMEDAADTLRAATGDVTNGLDVDVTRVQGTVTVDGSGVTQPVSAASLPLPTGAATAANQLPDGHNVTVDNASIATTNAIVDAAVATEGAALGSGVLIQGDDGTDRKNINVDATTGDVQVDVTNTVTVDGSGVTQPVSAASLPLPTGAATETTLAAVQTAVEIMDDWDETNRAAVNLIASQVAITGGAGAVAANTPRTTLASDDPAVTSLAVMDDWDNAASDGASVSGDVAHDAADAGEPVKVGMKAVSHGAITEVAANDRTDWFANLAGVPFVIGGHPNVQTFRANYTTAQTDTAIVSTTEKIVVTRVSVTADNANTVDVQVRIGFGATTTPTGAGVLLSHPGIAAGSGVVEGSGAGMLGVGAAGEDLRITSEVPTTGSIDVVVSYYEIAS